MRQGFDPGSRRPPGGGHSSSLQYSRLEDPMDRGVWRATARGVAKSWTQLKRLSTRAHVQRSLVSQHHSGLSSYTETSLPVPWGPGAPPCPPPPSFSLASKFPRTNDKQKKRKVYSKMLLSTLRSQKAEYSQGPSELLTPLGCGPSPNYKSLSAPAFPYPRVPASTFFIFPPRGRTLERGYPGLPWWCGG